MACCDDKDRKGCMKPENLKDTPENCSPEQIKTCHGEHTDEHPCCEHPGCCEE
jgi:hypothetical protein